MQSGKFIIVLAIIFMLILSCNAGIKNLPVLYGKKLYASYMYMLGSNELILYADSTFKYTGAGLARNFTIGKWWVHDKKSIILTSGTYNLVPNKQIVDTILVNFDNRIIKIKGRDKVELNDEVFITKEPLYP